MNTLQEIYKKYRHITDKGTTHSYIDWYADRLAPMRTRAVEVLEIGVAMGGSLMMWRDYFQHGTIHGMDVLQPPGVPFDPPIHPYLRDGTRGESYIGIPMMDLIVDDGSHRLADMMLAFKNASKRLKPEGLYVIEDVQDGKDLETLLNYLPGSHFVDLRPIKGRYDDMLVVWQREKSGV